MKRVLALSVFSLGAIIIAADEVNLVKLHVDSFAVIGTQTRTSNAREATADAQIPAMWSRVLNDNLLARIPHRVDDRIVAVYTDYESDKDGPYTYILGAKVSSSREVPPGMVARKIDSGDYAMFTAKGGSPSKMTVNLWKRIWSLERPGPLHRAYKTDFEVHYGGPDAETAQVDIYIGLQK